MEHAKTYNPTRQGSDAGFLFVPPAILSKRPSSVGSHPGATLAGTQAEFTMEDFCFVIRIPLNQGKFALIDDEDGPRVLAFKWTYYYHPKSNKGYIHRTIWIPGGKGKSKTVHLHRFILNAPEGVQVDHRDNDGLNCQKANLRLANNSQNHQNMKMKKGSAIPFKGVGFDKRRQRYYAKIRGGNGSDVWLGSFLIPQDAARAYDEKAREFFGEFARLNFPNPDEQGARE